MSQQQRDREMSDTFRGGPFDGYPVTEADYFYTEHTFDFYDRIAVYDGFSFRGIRDRDDGDDEYNEDDDIYDVDDDEDYDDG